MSSQELRDKVAKREIKKHWKGCSWDNNRIISTKTPEEIYQEVMT